MQKFRITFWPVASRSHRLEFNDQIALSAQNGYDLTQASSPIFSVFRRLFFFTFFVKVTSESNLRQCSGTVF